MPPNDSHGENERDRTPDNENPSDPPPAPESDQQEPETDGEQTDVCEPHRENERPQRLAWKFFDCLHRLLELRRRFLQEGIGVDHDVWSWTASHNSEPPTVYFGKPILHLEQLPETVTNGLYEPVP